MEVDTKRMLLALVLSFVVPFALYTLLTGAGCNVPVALGVSCGWGVPLAFDIRNAWLGEFGAPPGRIRRVSKKGEQR